MKICTITPLAYEDQELANLDMPSAPMRILRGLGSGLSKSSDGRIWAVGDRGPNLKIELAIERYGLAALKGGDFPPGAKVMPCLEIGPSISELRVHADRVELVRTLTLGDRRGKPLSGLPTPCSDHGEMEPAIDVEGRTLPTDPAGADSEGIVALADGGFWVGDEYGPSLLRVSADGVVEQRWVPEGTEGAFQDAPFPVRSVLPRIATKRQLNRGFEAIGISPDQRVLYLAFQSPLALPDEAAHKKGRWVRLWTLDAASGDLLAQFAYPFDEPGSFLRDGKEGPVDWGDLKVSELTVIGEDHLLVLERGSHTTKLYEVRLDPTKQLDRALADPETRPTFEQLSAAGDGSIPLLGKRLVLSTDDHPEIGPDLEGLILLGPSSLLLVNDNDFGVEGVTTRFWRVELSEML